MRTTLNGARAYLQENPAESAVYQHVWSPIPDPGLDVLCFATTGQIQIETLSGELLVTCYLNLKTSNRTPVVDLPPDPADSYQADSYEDDDIDVLIALDEL
jgi:hypothetical protein